jgi:hypothetical protein
MLYLLRWNVEGDRSEVDLLITVGTRDDEKNSGTFSATLQRKKTSILKEKATGAQ